MVSVVIVVVTSLIVMSIILYSITVKIVASAPASSSTQRSTKAFSPGPKYSRDSFLFVISAADSFSVSKKKRDGGFRNSDALFLFNL